MIRASPWSVPASRRSDAKGGAKRNPLRGERTDAEYGDGPSSNRANGGQSDRAKGTDQVAVVRVQQRQEEIRDDGKTALHPQTAGVRGLRAPKANADSVGGDKEKIEDFEAKLSATFPALGFSSSEFQFRLVFPLASWIIEARGLTRTKLN